MAWVYATGKSQSEWYCQFTDKYYGIDGTSTLSGIGEVLGPSMIPVGGGVGAACRLAELERFNLVLSDLRTVPKLKPRPIEWAGRDPNYRRNLEKELGKPPVGPHDAHHVRPVEFGERLALLGLDVNAPQFGTRVPRAEHQGFSGEYSKDWAAFLRGTPSREQVLDFARVMGEKYGFKVHF